MVVALMEETVETGIVTCRICYSWALKVYGEGERWAEAAGLLRSMSDLGIDLDPFTYSLAIAASRHRRDNGSRSGSGTSGGGSSSSSSSRNRSSSRSSDISSSSDRLSSAVSLLDEMRKVGLKPELLTYITAIRACAGLGESELARSLLEDMSVAGVKRDRTVYAGAITACCASGDLKNAASLLEDMLAEEIPADIIASNVLMRAYAEAGQWEEAVSALRLLQGARSSPAPTADCFGSAVAACAAAGRAVEALALLLDMLEAGLSPDASSYSATVEAYGWGTEDASVELSGSEHASVRFSEREYASVTFSDGGSVSDRGRALDRRRAEVGKEVDRVAAATGAAVGELDPGSSLGLVRDGVDTLSEARGGAGVRPGVGLRVETRVEVYSLSSTPVVV